MGNSLYETRLQGIMVVAFIKPNDEYSYYDFLRACPIEGMDPFEDSAAILNAIVSIIAVE